MKAKLLAGLQAVAIIAAGLWVFWPAMRGEWIWDDRTGISQNPLMRDPAGLRRLWFAPPTPDYFPLTTTVQWTEWRLWGDDQAAFHWTNVGLHLLSALLFWRLLRKVFALSEPSTLPPSASLHSVSRGAGLSTSRAFGAWFGGLLFAVHPLAVESVAWIAELKNALSLPLLLLAMSAWVEFDLRWSALSPTRWSGRRVEQARWGQRAPPCYWLALVWFLLAMLAKSSVVMLPVVLLLYAWWRRGRVGRTDVRASLPFFAISLVLGLVTLWFQRHRTMGVADAEVGGIVSRAAAAGLAIPFYLGKFLLPIGLAPIYPRWNVVPPPAWDFLPWLVLTAIGAGLWARRTGWGRPALFGLGFFVINLVPVLGFIPMAYLHISWVADHFVYLPMLGLIGLAAAGAGALAGRLTRQKWRVVLAATAVVGCGGLAWQSRGYAANYSNNARFWGYALQRNPAAWIAHNNRGVILSEARRLPEAIVEYETALRLRPDYPDAHNDLGNALVLSGRLREAIAEFEEAVRLRPDFVAARCDLGHAFTQIHEFDRAIAQYQKAVQLDPDDAGTRVSFGFAWMAAGRMPEAIGQFEEAVRLQPGSADWHYLLGIALRDAGRSEEADAQFSEARGLRTGR